jgi:hypothetical protein
MGIPDEYQLPVAGSGKEYELLPDDVYEVVISKLELKKDQPIYNSQETEDKFAFEFTVSEEGKYKGRKLWLDVRTVFSAGSTGFSPSWLYKIFSAVNGVNLNDEEARSVTAKNINEMFGKSLRLVVQQKQNTKGDMKNKISNVMASKASNTVPSVSNFEKSLEEIPTPQPPELDEDIRLEDIPF